MSLNRRRRIWKAAQRNVAAQIQCGPGVGRLADRGAGSLTHDDHRRQSGVGEILASRFLDACFDAERRIHARACRETEDAASQQVPAQALVTVARRRHRPEPGAIRRAQFGYDVRGRLLVLLGINGAAPARVNACIGQRAVGKCRGDAEAVRRRKQDIGLGAIAQPPSEHTVVPSDEVCQAVPVGVNGECRVGAVGCDPRIHRRLERIAVRKDKHPA